MFYCLLSKLDFFFLFSIILLTTCVLVAIITAVVVTIAEPELLNTFTISTCFLIWFASFLWFFFSKQKFFSRNKFKNAYYLSIHLKIKKIIYIHLGQSSLFKDLLEQFISSLSSAQSALPLHMPDLGIHWPFLHVASSILQAIIS